MVAVFPVSHPYGTITDQTINIIAFNSPVVRIGSLLPLIIEYDLGRRKTIDANHNTIT